MTTLSTTLNSHEPNLNVVKKLTNVGLLMNPCLKLGIKLSNSPGRGNLARKSLILKLTPLLKRINLILRTERTVHLRRDNRI